MSDTFDSHRLLQNRILSKLPKEEFDFLKPHLELMSLPVGEILFQPGDPVRYLYFPLNGMISVLFSSEQGSTVEVGFTGKEGLLGVTFLLGQSEMPYYAMVQVSTKCVRVDAKAALKLFNKGGKFHQAALQYIYLVLKQVSQTCICNHFHTIESRLCRWLAVIYERSEDKHLSLTQEFLAQMLGVQRTSVGMIANTLQNRGIIRYSRGKIEIVNQDELKNNVCECYHLLKAEYAKILKQE